MIDLLQHELQEVGEGLQQAERAHHVGALAHLHAGPDLAVGQQQEGEAQQRPRSTTSRISPVVSRVQPTAGGREECSCGPTPPPIAGRAPASVAEHSAMVTLARAIGLVRWKAVDRRCRTARPTASPCAAQALTGRTRRPSRARRVVDLAEGRVVGEQLGAQLLQAVVGQRRAQVLGQGAQHRPSLRWASPLGNTARWAICTRPSVFT